MNVKKKEEEGDCVESSQEAKLPMEVQEQQVRSKQRLLMGGGGEETESEKWPTSEPISF